ncbi:MAG: transglutaminase domain-containing protein [Candidatus Riflebacteria bacterium]|nr:transglutaminase domain-containing protein [Candidatus Riflebacteria bacterium]
MKRIIMLCLLIFSLSQVFAGEKTDAFFHSSDIGLNKKYEPLQIEKIELFDEGEVDVQTYNECVDLNRQAIEAMRNRNYEFAEKLLQKACGIMPSEKTFWNNRLIALNNIKNRELDAIKAGLVMMNFEPDNYKYAYNIGITYMNLKQYEKAAAYFYHSKSIEPKNPDIILSFVKALESLGGYEEEILSVLKESVYTDNTGYLSYLLGLIYLDKKEYNHAIKAFDNAKNLDKKGFAHYAYIRARFLAGKHENLAFICKETITAFPNDQNKIAAMKIFRSLTPGDYKFIETINIDIKNASKLGDLELFYRDIPNIENHQKAELISAELISRGIVEPVLFADEPGAEAKKIVVSRKMLSPRIQLKIVHRIKTVATFNARIEDVKFSKNINDLSADERLSFNDKNLNRLYERIGAQPGNYIQNALIAIGRGLEYRENGVEFPVEWIFSNRSISDCTEYSMLLIALALKKGYPARMANGFLITTDNLDKETQIGHAWCEIYYDNKGWVPIDPTLFEKMDWAYFGNMLSDQILFGYMDSQFNASRLKASYSTAKNSGVQIDMSNSYKISDWSKR